MDYYVATTGNNGYNGALAAPFRDPQVGVDHATNAGDRLFIRAGTYDSGYYDTQRGLRVLNKTGTALNPIIVANYPGEEVIIDGINLSSGSGRYPGYIENCSYTTIKGIIFQNGKDSASYYAAGCAIEGGFNVIMDQCTVRWSANGFAYAGTNDYIYFKNCDSYENADVHDSGGLANGFSTNIDAGTHHFFDGCRAWANSDDGWDCFSNTYGSGYIEYNNCWAFENGYWDGYSGNGMGFKTGMSHNAATGLVQRRLTRCLSFDNTTGGYDESQDAYPGESSVSLVHEIYNCTSFRNGSGGFNFQFGKGYDNVFNIDHIKNNVSYAESVGSLNLPSPYSNDLVTNSWQLGITLTDADFLSVDPTGTKGARQANGDLPVLNFLKPSATSQLIDRGTNIGLTYSGTAPDLGAYESGGTSAIAVTAVTVTGMGGAIIINVDKGALQMSAHIDPHDATDKSVVWSVVNETGVGSIDQNGLLTAVANGTVTVKARSNG
jgi:hypothetical protein